ncbi:MAG TPA: hypothetical protein VGI38_01605 [Puia sp.]|jgi:hypothetical protein
MEKFLLIRRLDTTNGGNQTSESLAEYIPAMDKWIQSLHESGKYSSGAALSMNSQQVSKDFIVANNFYHEKNEGISGYDVILAENLNEAVSIAKTCPLLIKGIIKYEVRPIIPLIR